MGLPAAKQGDQVMAVDMHIVLVPAPPGPPVPMPLPHPFVGMLDGGLSTNVKIMGMPAATMGSTAKNTPSHIPTTPGTSFVVPPTNQANIAKGSVTVKINGKPAARLSDLVQTCADPVPNMGALLIAVDNMMIGG
jgi:uncharacterized Zn-binding protein involved in type VI secretion